MANGTSKETNATDTVESSMAESIAGKAAVTAGDKTETAKTHMTGKGQKAANESVYPVGELAANAQKIFGTRQECVLAALKAARRPDYTVPEAKEIVGRFLKKEVK